MIHGLRLGGACTHSQSKFERRPDTEQTTDGVVVMTTVSSAIMYVDSKLLARTEKGDIGAFLHMYVVASSAPGI